MYEVGADVRQNSPFAGAQLGEFAVGHGLSETEVNHALPDGESQRKLLGRKFPATHYPAVQAYGASAELLRTMFPDVDLGEDAKTILFGDEQGVFTSHADHGNTPTAEG